VLYNVDILNNLLNSMKGFCEKCNHYAPLLGRILLGGLFILAAYSKLTAVSGDVLASVSGFGAFLTELGLPAGFWVAILVIIVEIVAGLALILGYKTYYAANALALFTLGTVILVHRDLADISFSKNLAIIGGLLYVMAFGAGPISLDERMKEKKEADQVLAV
jgi:putative oxidoreductase